MPLALPEEQYVAIEVPDVSTRGRLSDGPISFRQGQGTADPGMSSASAVSLHVSCGSLSLLSSMV